MARIARVVVEHYPHHITQRGNRRQDTFFCDDDYRYYIRLMAEWCDKCGVTIWAYCLMHNHGALDCCAWIRRRLSPGNRRSAPALYVTYQFSGAMERLFMAGALCVFLDGWEVSSHSNPLHWTQSGQGWLGFNSWRISMEQCQGTHEREKRWSCEGTAIIEDGWRLATVSFRWCFRRGIRVVTTAWTNRKTF